MISQRLGPKKIHTDQVQGMIPISTLLLRDKDVKKKPGNVLT